MREREKTSEKEGIVLFPLTNKTLEMIITALGEYNKLTKQYKVYGIVPEAIYRGEIDAKYILNETCETGITAISESNISQYLPNCWFINITKGKEEDYSYLTKDIVNYLGDMEENVISFQELCCKEKRNDFSVKEAAEAFLLNEQLQNYRLKQPEVPIIGVGAVYRNYNTSRIVKRLKDTLDHCEKISVLYANELLYEAGVNSISPEKLRSMDFDLRVRFINFVVNQIAKLEQSSAIIIEVLGGLMKMDALNLNGSCEFPLTYTQAIDFDYFVCSVFLNDAEETMRYENVGEYLTRQYRFENISFHISNMLLSPMRTKTANNIPFTLVDTAYLEMVKSTLTANKAPCFNFLDPKDIMDWYNIIRSK